MKFHVFWTKEAEVSLGEIILYLEKEWSEKEIVNFLDRIEKVIALIKMSPELFPLSPTKGVRKAVIKKHSSLYYKIDKNQIIILSIRSNSKGPKNFPY
ncbi:type II toxin-antitoxin system RelE/ParE family toxin [Aquiflexum sp. TKW24L]|uniref:type II toxin-antitoxin system RelE/ParE family toxin n=1 Tax=Aquiflexum sp. TKW24L TaxID=2942212 RepID=UPI0020BD864E|nr:type II toxin-antitoxin system RelE/ParE family toxin [Aquiflexum sp. TKW24L]MCL6257849.1 type II toxin-antitoxin system RelE/ParE family toxin [Aquiflexum sp. TKW24L]